MQKCWVVEEDVFAFGDYEIGDRWFEDLDFRILNLAGSGEWEQVIYEDFQSC